MKVPFPKTPSHAFWLSFILCTIAGLVIIYPVSAVTGLSQSFGGGGNDGYIEIARNIVAGNGYVFEPDGPAVFHRPPLYPVFLMPTALMPQALERPFLILSQSFLAGWICFFLFSIAQSLFNKTVAKVALAILLCNPWLYWHIKNPMTAIIQCFLYMLLIYIFIRIVNGINRTTNKPFLMDFIFFGIAGAALSLVHAAMLPVFVLYIVAVAFWIFHKRHFAVLKYLFLSCLLSLLCILPWTIRNGLVTNSFVPVSSGSGLAYFNGNVHWRNIGRTSQLPGETYIDASLRALGIEGKEKDMIHFKGFMDFQLDRFANKKMAEDIKQRPGDFIKKFILNAIEYYFPVFVYKFRAFSGFTKEELLLTVFHLILWIFAVIGFVFSESVYRARSLMFLVAIFFYAIWYFPFATGFIGHNLYTFATMPLLAILSAGLFSSRRLSRT